MGAAALRYAAKGWHVFPCWWPTANGCACGKGEECERKAKHPIGRAVLTGLLEATTDPTIIRSWWIQYPLANVAIRCGAESGIIVLDVDAYKTGLDSLDALEAKNGKLPYSIRARTGSGGGSVHILFQHPRDGSRISSNSSGKLGPGLDIKADGGYIIVAPSMHASGGTYEWVDEDDSTLEPAPAWLLALFGKSSLSPTDPIHTGIELDEQHAGPLCAKLFARASERILAGSARHDTAVWLWTQMKDNAVPIAVARTWADPFLDLAKEAGAQRTVTDGEVQGIIGWAYAQARRDPFPSTSAALRPPQPMSDPADPAPADLPTAAPGVFPWIDLNLFRLELQTILATRAPTGIPALDACLGGGLPGGVVVTFVGAPGSCKSALAMQIGIARARLNGGRLYIYSPDQGGTQPLTRLADVYGDIASDDEAFQRFMDSVGPVVKVADERESGVSMESFRDAVIAAGDAAAVLVDTPQTVATKADDDGERSRINCAMDISRQIAAKLLIPVFCPSHANRAATAAKRKEDRMHPRSAALGSAGVEHRSQVLAYLEKIDRKDNQTEVEVTITKALGATGRIFRMNLDPTTWTLREIDKEAAEEAQQDEAETERKRLLAPAKEKIKKILKTNPDGLSGRALEERCGGKKAIHQAARLEMADSQELITEERSGRGGGLVWKLPILRHAS
jgi:hypothetical protein